MIPILREETFCPMSEEHLMGLKTEIGINDCLVKKNGSNC
jgi:hypothetical protein